MLFTTAGFASLVVDGGGLKTKLVAFGVMLVGIALLPQESDSISVEFSELKVSDEFTRSLSSEQINNYNNELPQINLAAQEIVAGVNSGNIISAQQAHDAWLSYRDQGLISRDAFLVLQKVSDRNAKILAQQL